MELAKRGLGKQLDRERQEEEQLLGSDLRARTPELPPDFTEQTNHEAATPAKPFGEIGDYRQVPDTASRVQH